MVRATHSTSPFDGAQGGEQSRTTQGPEPGRGSRPSQHARRARSPDHRQCFADTGGPAVLYGIKLLSRKAAPPARVNAEFQILLCCALAVSFSISGPRKIRSLTQHRDDNRAGVGLVPVLPEVDPLPSAQQQLAI